MDTQKKQIRRYKEINHGEVSLPICFDRAIGSYIFDENGNEYLDFTSGYGVTSTGWLRNEMTDAIADQLQRSAYAPPWMATKEAIELSELLLQITPENLVKCARATGGADANEIIFKAVMAGTGKNGVVSFRNSYHGGTHFALNISDAQSFNLPNVPRGADYHFADPPYCFRCLYKQTIANCEMSCLAQIEELIQSDNRIGSIFIEPTLGSGGVITLPVDYVKKLREICDRHHVFLVFDEVLTGFGRLGYLTASDLYDVHPDAISFGKGISSGYAALGAAVLNDELGRALKSYEDVSATFAWTPLSCKVATTNIKLIISENLSEKARKQGEFLLEKTRSIFQKHIPEYTGEVRGTGFMIGVELVTDQISKKPNPKLVQRILLTTFRKGLLLCVSWDFNVLIMMPPLSTSISELRNGLHIIESSLEDIKHRFKKLESGVQDS